MSLTFRLSYGDCDALGIAYFDIYYRWMERAYTGWLYEHGLRSAELIPDLGISTVGVHSSCEYRAAVRVFDELTCRLVRDRIGTSSYTVGFDFVRDGTTVSHGTMTFACRLPDGGRAPIPPRLHELLTPLPTAGTEVPS